MNKQIVLRKLRSCLAYLGAIAFWTAFVYLVAEFLGLKKHDVETIVRIVRKQS